MNSQNKNNHLFQPNNGAIPKAVDQNHDSAWDRSRMMRIILESLEVGLLLCNLFFDRYGLAKLFNIVNQILPTAYILNTGYWVFYSSQNGHCICICNRFGLRCPHRRCGFHWIDIDALKDAEENYLFSVQNGKMFPVNFNITVDPIINDVLRAYDINIRLTVQPFDVQGNKYVPITDQKTTLLIDARYILTPAYFPLQSAVVQFNPHPMSHPHYSQYFECLRRLNVFYSSSSPLQVQVPRTYTIVCSDIPNFTVITNNTATSNFHPTPDMNVPAWSGPFSTFHGHFEEARPIATQINQQHFNFTNNAIAAPLPPPPQYNQVVPYQQVPSYQQVPPYTPTPTYQNRTNKRQYTEQTRFVPVQMFPENTAAKQKKRGKASVSTKPKTEPVKLPSMFQFPAVTASNFAYQEPSLPRQSSSVLTTTNTQISSSIQIVQNDEISPTFNPTIRKPVYPTLAQAPEINFFGPDYSDIFPALPEPNNFKRKPKQKSITSALNTQVTDAAPDCENFNIAMAFDNIVPQNVQNLKSQMEVQSIVSIRYDTEVSQMIQQSPDTITDTSDELNSNEFLSMITDVIEEDVKDPQIIKPEEFEEFQQAHSNIELPVGSPVEPFSPDDDCLYIDEFDFLNDEKK